MNSLLVESNGLKYQGYEQKESLIWRGVPYATTRRFEKPEKYLPEGYPENNIIDCNEEIEAYQLSAFLNENEREFSFYSKEFRTDRKGRLIKYADSPMTLNIITPKEGGNYPVFVFIHGGGFETGTVGETPYGYTEEYAKRGVILVSIGYRLNVFSYYNNMNLGLFDQDFAIRWVYDNIANFGGNKEQIIIGGQSAGAMSTIDLLLTKRLEGIVKGAIVMSGAGPLPKFAGPRGLEEQKWYWEKIEEKAGCHSLDDMKNVDPEVLWKAYYEARKEKCPLFLQQPGIDGEIIPMQPLECLKKKIDLDVPVILGVTGQDFMPLVIYIFALNWAKNHAKRGMSPIYGYFFDKTPPGGDYKAFHAIDLWYAFGNMDKCWRGFKNDDEALKNEICDYFANFIKTLNPNSGTLPLWNPVTKKFKGFRYFNGLNDGHIMPGKAKRLHLKVLLKDHGPM